MPHLSAINRHPVKALGHEALTHAALTPGEALPGDRVWAVLHDRSKLAPDPDGWARCTTFLRGAACPSLMAVRSAGGPGAAITFSHPDRPPLVVDPGTEAGAAALIAWIDPLIQDGMPRPMALHRAARGLTDSRAATVSLMSDASLAALSAHAGLRLLRRRFRGNLWVGDLPAWSEAALTGAAIRIGPAVLDVLGPIERCSAIQANPDTARRDADVLRALETACGAPEFGLHCVVRDGGEIALGDALDIL
jgi:uncharacterized protein YcbX